MTAVRRNRWGGVAGRFAAPGSALLFIAAAGGCGADPDGYEPELRYSLRSDVLVIQPPAAAPLGLLPPGNRKATGAMLLRPGRLSDARRAEVAATLDTLFGTPAAPAVPDGPAVPGLDLSAESLAAGSRVYRRLCGQCHGVAGDGRGPTGAWVYPYPRDFRPGVFKLADAGGKPSAESLAALLRRGLPGTAMPAFGLLSEADLRAVTAYVVHLSLRGETEFRTLRTLLDGEDGDPDAAVEATCRRAATACRAAWAAAPAGPPPAPEPADPDYQAYVRRGMALFGGAAGCAGCHVDYGRKDEFRYDVWGLPVRVPDLTAGEYRWGGSVASLTRRVRHGIPASGMPANPGLSDDEVRDVVAFVRALPGPPRLPEDVRDRVYPGRGGDVP